MIGEWGSYDMQLEARKAELIKALNQAIVAVTHCERLGDARCSVNNKIEVSPGSVSLKEKRPTGWRTITVTIELYNQEVPWTTQQTK